MIIFFTNIVALVVLGILVLRHGRDQRIGRNKVAHWLRIAGLIPLGLQVLVSLDVGIGGMASSELGGALYLLEAIVLALLGMFAWLRPLEGGIALLACGALSTIGFLVAFVPLASLVSAEVSYSGIITGIPQIVSGALFLFAGNLSRKGLIP